MPLDKAAPMRHDGIWTAKGEAMEKNLSNHRAGFQLGVPGFSNVSVLNLKLRTVT
jgi:hypothetical protein